MTLTEYVRECPVCGREIRVLAGRLASHMASEGPCVGGNILVSWKEYSSFPQGSGNLQRGCQATDEEGEAMKGLYGKYTIEKQDGTPIDPDARYFVLRIDTDPHARVALKAYSDSVLSDNPKLAVELMKLLIDTGPQFHAKVGRAAKPLMGEEE